MLKFKAGVKISGVRPETLIGMQVAEGVYEYFNHPLTITSCMDGVHKEGSLHYKGLAFDCRIWGFAYLDLEMLVEKLRANLEGEWDVVLERDHIHVEFDPD